MFTVGVCMVIMACRFGMTKGAETDKTNDIYKQEMLEYENSDESSDNDLYLQGQEYYFQNYQNGEEYEDDLMEYHYMDDDEENDDRGGLKRGMGYQAVGAVIGGIAHLFHRTPRPTTWTPYPTHSPVPPTPRPTQKPLRVFVPRPQINPMRAAMQSLAGGRGNSRGRVIRSAVGRDGKPISRAQIQNWGQRIIGNNKAKSSSSRLRRRPTRRTTTTTNRNRNNRNRNKRNSISSHRRIAQTHRRGRRTVAAGRRIGGRRRRGRGRGGGGGGRRRTRQSTRSNGYRQRRRSKRN